MSQLPVNSYYNSKSLFLLSNYSNYLCHVMLNVSFCSRNHSIQLTPFEIVILAPASTSCLYINKKRDVTTQWSFHVTTHSDITW